MRSPRVKATAFSVALRSTRLVARRSPHGPIAPRLIKRVILPLAPSPPAGFIAELEGRKIPLLYKELIGAWVLLTGEYETAEIRLCRGLAANGTAIDVGAHAGLFTTAVAETARKVWAFEPNARTVSRLGEAIRLNKITNVEVFAAAVGAEVGASQMDISADPSLTKLTAHGAVIKVEQLDRLWNERGQPHVTVVKIDTEGTELNVITGATRLIARCCPALLVEATTERALQQVLSAVENNYVAEQPIGFQTHNYLLTSRERKIKQPDVTPHIPDGSVSNEKRGGGVAPDALRSSPWDKSEGAVDEATLARAEGAFLRLSNLLLRDDFKGWDPYDALASPLVNAVARSRRTRTVAVQALRRFPLNLRAILGVPRIQHVKALALGVSAYARAADSLSDSQYANYAEALAELVLDRALERPSGLAWGYEFDVQTRWGYYRAGEPNAIVTSFAANALLDVAAASGRSVFSEAAAAAVSFVLDELLVDDRHGPFFTYVPGSTVLIHNANVLVSGLVARVDRSSELALDAAWTTVRRQHAIGAWPYGERAGLEWVDGFHTAYVLDALQRWVAVGVSDFEQPVSRGLAFSSNGSSIETGRHVRRRTVAHRQTSTLPRLLWRLYRACTRSTIARSRLRFASSGGRSTICGGATDGSCSASTAPGGTASRMCVGATRTCSSRSPSSRGCEAVMADRVTVLSTPIDRLDMDETVAACERLIAARTPSRHMAVNAAKLVAMRSDTKLREAVTTAEVISADGQAVVWASRLLGEPLPERVAGIDLMWRLLARSEQSGYRVFVLGARSDVLAEAIARINRAFHVLHSPARATATSAMPRLRASKSRSVRRRRTSCLSQ